MKHVNSVKAVLGLLVSSVMWSAQALAECTMDVSQPQLDFGMLQRDNTIRSEKIALGERSVSINVSCERDSDMTLFLRGTALDSERFKWDAHSNYRVRLSGASLDGKPVVMIETVPTGEGAVTAVASEFWRPGRGVVPMTEGRVMQGKHLRLQASFVGEAATQAFRVRDNTEWQAQAMVELPSGGVSRELTLRAEINAASCVPTLSKNSVDYGKRMSNTLATSGPTLLTGGAVDLTIACDAAALFALKVIENRPGTASMVAPVNFGLGIANGAPIGFYTVSIQGVSSVPGGGAHPTGSRDDGVSWMATEASGGWALRPGDWVGFHHTAAGTLGPDEFTRVTATLSLMTFIAPASQLNLTREILLDGSITLEMTYL